MPTLLKKFVLSFLSALVLLFSFAPNFAYAQVTGTAGGTVGTVATPTAPPEGTWYNQGFGEWYSKVYDENVSPSSDIFGERYTAAQVQWVIYSLMAFILNASLGGSTTSQQAVSCFLTNTVDVNSCVATLKALISSSNSASPLAKADNRNIFQLVFATDRPFSGISYVKEKVQNFSLVPVAHAAGAGFGFDALAPIQSMWSAARNVAFGLFVLVAVIFAFMIMFRVKISPQVVISVQSAIPKLIIALVLVTFSYAIAGFLIDLMYVVIGIFAVIFPAFATTLTPVQAFDFMMGVFANSGTQGGIVGLIGFSIVYLFHFAFSLLAGLAFLLIPMFGKVLGNILTGVAIIFVIILTIVGVFVVIWNMIRAWWMLLKAFVNILLLTIFAPLNITLGIVVSGLGFGSWVKNFIANLATFAMAGVLMLFSAIFLNLAWFKIMGTGGYWQVLAGAPWIPNITTGGGDIAKYWPPLLGSGGGDPGIGLMFLGVSFVIFTLIPKSADVIAGFMSGKPFAYGTAIGEAMGPARTVGMYGAAEGLNVAERIGTAGSGTSPGWVQASRKVLGLKP